MIVSILLVRFVDLERNVIAICEGEIRLRAHLVSV
jgi:hypothetical protein